MALDGILLSKIIPDIKKLCPCKINKIYKISNTEILMQLRNYDTKKTLMISCHPLYNRINLTDKEYPTPEEPGNFVMLLRKHIEGSTIIDVMQKDLDRWCCFTLSMRNALGDKTEKKLYIELMGKYANIILVDENNKIIDAMKRIPPFENNKRTIQPGAIFNEVEPQNKLNPFDYPIINKELSLTTQLAGFSPLLSKEVEYRLTGKQTLKEVIKEIKQSNSLYIVIDNEEYFHCIPLTHLGNCKKYPLNEGIDVLYYHKEEKERIKQLAGDIFKIVKRELKHQKGKLIKLESSLEESKDSEKWKTYGELLYAYNITDTKGKAFIMLESFEDNTLIKVPLDIRLNGKANAKKAFQKYEKLKKSKEHLTKQIQLTKDEIEYFEIIEQQLEEINVNDAKEIIAELISGGYINPNKIKQPKKKKKESLPAISYIETDNTRIYFGKNNLQNETLTFKLAKKHHYFFHVKDIHGAHVIVDTDNLSEKIIRLAANIAACYSKGKYSSSVPVDYTQVKNLKKIPKAKIGKVSLSNYKTIYIDPSQKLINSYPILTLR